MNTEKETPTPRPDTSTTNDEVSNSIVLPDEVQPPKVSKIRLSQEQSDFYKERQSKSPTQQQQKKDTISAFQFYWSEPKTKIGIITLGVLVFSVPFIIYRFSGEKATYLQGDETVTVTADGEKVMNEEQAKFARQKAISEQGEGQSGINISTATKRVIRPSEFTAQDFQDTQRFKRITDKETQQDLFVDVTTNKKYDEQGNEVVDVPIEQPYYSPAPISYSQFNQHPNYAQYREQSEASGQSQELLLGNNEVGQPTQAEQTATTPVQNYQAPPTPYSTYTTMDGQQVPITHSSALQGQIDSLNYQSQQHSHNMALSNQRTMAVQQAIQQDIQRPRPSNPLQEQARSSIQSTVAKLNQPSSYGTFNYDVRYAQGSIGEYKNQINTGQINPISAMPTPYNQGGLSTPAQGQVKLLPPHVIRQGTTWLVMIDQDVNSDKSNLVRGVILDGHYKGGIIYGVLIPTGSRNLAGAVRFDTIEPKNPRQPVVALSAQGLNLKDNSPDVTTSVKRHYAQNYGAIVVESVAQGYGDAYSNVGESTVITDNGTVITTRSNKVNSDQIRGEVIGALSDRLNTDLARLGNRPPTFMIKKGTVIKVRLMTNLDTLTGLALGSGQPNSTTTHTIHQANN